MDPAKQGRARSIAIAAIVGFWAVAVLVGFGGLYIYKSKPGDRGASPGSWPEGTAVVRSPDWATLVMLAHPKCPCTRASVSELARLMGHYASRLQARVLFLQPKGTPERWEETDLWRSAAAIPGVEVVADPEGAEANRFGVRTSGHILLYDAAGRLQFSGGLTASRGHEGDSFGRERIIAVLNGLAPDRADSPVFGCPLFEKSQTLAFDLRKD